VTEHTQTGDLLRVINECSVRSCGVDVFLINDTCTPVGTGYYSSETSPDRLTCTTKPANSLYTTSGGGVDNCSWSCDEGFYKDQNECLPLICAVGATESCSVEGGQGERTCLENGSGYGQCEISACDVDYYKQGDSCVPVAVGEYSPVNNVVKYQCQNKPTGSVYTTTGGGQNNCSWSCNANYFQVGQTCVSQSCTPGQTRVCEVTNGGGVATCNTQGSEFGACAINQCGLDFYLNGGSCNAVRTGEFSPVNNPTKFACTNKPPFSSYSSVGSGSNNCEWTCNSGYFKSGNLCKLQACTPNQTSACAIANGTGEKKCSTTGEEYGSCTVKGCGADYFLNGTTCGRTDIGFYSPSGSTENIACSNGPANSIYTTRGNGTNSCQWSCSEGFFQSGNSCSPKACEPSETINCSVNYGQGVRTCNTTGSGYGSCFVSTCDVDHFLNGGSCQNVGIGSYSPANNKNKISCTNKPTGSTYTTSGNGRNNCTWTCNSGYYLSGNTCKAQVCTPGKDSTCSVSNGNGIKECNSTGSAYNACTVSGCGIDYFLNGATCKDVGTGYYSPNLNKLRLSCSNKPTNATYTTSGSGINNCSWTCNGGFYKSGNSCIAQICEPGKDVVCSISNGNGIKTCNTTGNNFGACTIAGCGIDYYLNGGTCKTVASGEYSPNKNKSKFSCTNKPPYARYTSSGNGTNSCLWACNTGYYRSGNVCRPNVCSPGQDSTCAITNGNGLKTCNTLGSAFSSCTIAGCGLDFYLNGGSCKAVGVGKYSPSQDKQIFNCSNKPLYATYTSTGNGTNSCEWSCNSGYYKSGNSCVVQTCSPGSKTSCTFANGAGQKTCNGTGSGYNACVSTGCNLDYFFEYGICKPVGIGAYSANNDKLKRVCTVKPTHAVFTSSGNGTNNCSWACNSDRVRVGTTCPLKTCEPGTSDSCTIANGIGSKACNSTGSAYNACVATGCRVDYSYLNGACTQVPVGFYSLNNDRTRKACTNRPTRSVYTSRGNGANNCSWSCNSGYTKSGNSCVAEVCSPGSKASCAIGNGIGEKACN